jgi:hypothetical protein
MCASSSPTYLFARLASAYALQVVSYSMQVVPSFFCSFDHIDLSCQGLGKSVKPIPVMLLGVLVPRKRYSSAKYRYVLLIVLGNVERDESA